MTVALRPERGAEEAAHHQAVGGCHTTKMIGGSKNPDTWWEKKCVPLNKEDCNAKDQCKWSGWR